MKAKIRRALNGVWIACLVADDWPEDKPLFPQQPAVGETWKQGINFVYGMKTKEEVIKEINRLLCVYNYVEQRIKDEV